MNLPRFIGELFSRYPWLLIGNALLALLLMVIDAATLASIAPVVNLLTQGSGTDAITPIVTDVLTWIGIEPGIEAFLTTFVILTVLNSLMLVLINYFILRAQYAVRSDMMVGTAEKVIRSSSTYVNRQHQGDFINTLTQEAARVADAFTALTRQIAPIGQAIILLSVPFLISWQVTGFALIAITILTVPLRLLRKRGYKLGQVFTKSSNHMATKLQESLQNLRLIAGFANENRTIRGISDAFSRVRDSSVKMQILQTSVHSAYGPIGIVVVFLTFLMSRHLGVELSAVAVILYAFNRLAGALATINQNRLQLIGLYPSYEQVMRVRREADESRLRFGEKAFAGLKKEIRIEDVSFSYDVGQPILKNINLTIPAGAMTALVGASGSGKSTLADMAMGLLQPTSGRILIDGCPLNDMDISTYRSTLGYVPQQPALFHMSVRDNIAWARPDADDAEIWRACRLAHADEFVNALEDGLDTAVGDRGSRLSGGQLQRIALARAMVREPSLLVLDEATSALDSESEAAIQGAIESIIGNTTILVIAHRLSTISKAQNIAVLDKGLIVEQGTFDALIARGGTFARLVEMQKLPVST